MCGIAGFVGPEASPGDRARAWAMASTLAHRGPDAGWAWAEGGAALAMRRLAIIDLSGGRQPLTNEDESVRVVFNGEIYNYRELARDLEGRGHRLNSRSDGEVLPHLYEERGADFLRDLNGMFALALWDGPRRRLLLARDHVGIKPLYHAQVGPCLLFGSELKALLAHPDLPREIDPAAIHHFLAVNYMPHPFTAVRGVRKIPPGHRLVFEGGSPRIEQYFDLPMTPVDDRPVPELEEELLARLDAAVDRQRVADVPLGVFLSGGVDSSTIAALLARRAPGVKTFSIGFAEESYSELPAARLVARHIGSEHREEIVSPDVVDLLPRIARHADEPSADSSAIPTWHVSRLARSQVTVALSGDGGDELFGGYLTYVADRIAPWLAWLIPGPVRRGIVGPIVRRLPVSSRKVSLEYKLKRLIPGLDLEPLRRHYWWNGSFGEEERRALYTPDFARAVGDCDTLDVFRDVFERCRGEDPLDPFLYLDAFCYLSDDILVKVDRMSMAHALEARVPILDREVMEFAARLPRRLKVRGLSTKWILKRVARRLLPPQVAARPKQGFSIPVHEWLRGPLAPMIRDLVASCRFQNGGVFDPAAVGRLVEAHQSRRENNGFLLWPLLMLALWEREVLGAPVPPPAEPPGPQTIPTDGRNHR